MMSIKKMKPATSPGSDVERGESPTLSGKTEVEVKDPGAPAGSIGPGGPDGAGGPPKEIFPEMDMEKNLVGWTGQDDPAHPR